MANRSFFLICLFFSINLILFAMGNADNAGEPETRKEKWFLCVTEFDSSSIPENKKSISDNIMKKLVESLVTINFRTRVSPEYAYYEAAARAEAKAAAAKAIEAKQRERSLLLYRGDPGWRYQRNLEKMDTDIKNLRIAFEKVSADIPYVDNEPFFTLTSGNLEFNFPVSPDAGNEYKFCIDQKADALLAGSITEFHERFIVSWKLYTIYSGSFILEDSIIFSHKDIDEAMDEIIRRLIIVLSGNEPAVLTIKTEPENTLVLINKSFASRGEAEKLEYPPGTVTITASAPDHKMITFETELLSGENINIDIKLRPVEYEEIEISSLFSGNVYHGALYAGEAPLTLRLPVNQIEYIELLSDDRARSAMVFQTPAETDLNKTIFLHPRIPAARGSVEKARSMYYWAWGGTWIAGIAAWLTYQSFTGSNSAVNFGYNRDGGYNENFYNSNNAMYNVSMGALITLGVVAVIDVILMSRYIYTANRGSTPVAKIGGN